MKARESTPGLPGQGVGGVRWVAIDGQLLRVVGETPGRWKLSCRRTVKKRSRGRGWDWASPLVICRHVFLE